MARIEDSIRGIEKYITSWMYGHYPFRTIIKVKYYETRN